MQENYNATIHFLTGNDQLDIELLNIEIATSYIDLLSTILGIISAQKAKQLIIQRIIQQQQNQQQPQNQQNQQQPQNQQDQQQSQQGQQQNQQNQQNQQQQPNSSEPTPSQIAAFASCLSVYTIITYTRISFIRLNEVYNNILAGTSNFSIGPNVSITTGFIYSSIGTLLRTVGAIRRVEEEAQITIL